MEVNSYPFGEYGQTFHITVDNGKVTKLSVTVDSTKAEDWAKNEQYDEAGFELDSISSAIVWFSENKYHPMEDHFKKVDLPIDSVRHDGEETTVNFFYTPTLELVCFKAYYSSYEGFDNYDHSYFTAPVVEKTIFTIGKPNYL